MGGRCTLALCTISKCIQPKTTADREIYPTIARLKTSVISHVNQRSDVLETHYHYHILVCVSLLVQLQLVSYGKKESDRWKSQTTGQSQMVD